MTHQAYLATPSDLTTFAWSAPMRDLAALIGMSDVGLRKFLRSHEIAIPPQGHWNRVRAGRTVPRPPRPRARGPGESGRIRLDARFAGHVAASAPIAEGGPFASARVAESLDELRAAELRAIGRVPVARSLERSHPALRPLLRREEQRRAKAAVSGWAWDGPRFAGPLAQRQLRIFDALLRALAKRECSGWVRAGYDELSFGCTIGERNLGLAFSAAGGRGTGSPRGARLAGDLPASTKLRLSLASSFRSPVTTAWDDGDGRLEGRIGAIAADLIVAGEAAFREGLTEAREHAERMARWRVEQEAAERERLRRKWIADLEASGELLRQANAIRALVAEVRVAVTTGALPVSADQLARWAAWADGEADRVDPVLSGQVLTHLVVPALDNLANEGVEPGFT